MSNRDNLPIEWKRKLGNTCCNCGSQIDIQYHHIVPIAAGGNHILSNLVCICGTCHAKIHGNKRVENWKELHAAGIKKAQDNGVHFGKQPAEYEKIMASIAKHLTVFEGGDLTEDEIMELNNIKKTTFHKIRRMLYEELEQDNWAHDFPRPVRILKTPLYKNQILEARQLGISIKELQEKRLNKK